MNDDFYPCTPIVHQRTCVTVDTDMGYESIPIHHITSPSFSATELGISIKEASEGDAEEAASLREHILPYLEGEPDMSTLLVEEGWLAYLSMYGYLDRTGYTLHESEEEAWEYLVETYGGEEE